MIPVTHLTVASLERNGDRCSEDMSVRARWVAGESCEAGHALGHTYYLAGDGARIKVRAPPCHTMTNNCDKLRHASWHGRRALR